METKNKKTIGGIALAAILVAGMFTFMPQSASADLTALDKFGTIINMLTKILTEVTETNEDLLLKKRFYQFVNDTDNDVQVDKLLIAEVRVVSCAPELQLANACAFNVESILIEAVDDDGPLLVVGPLVDGIGSSYEARERGDVNFLVDAFKTVELPEDGTTAIGPIGVIGASESVVVLIFSDEIIDKIEFNGEQPQGMELELVVTQKLIII